MKNNTAIKVNMSGKEYLDLKKFEYAAQKIDKQNERDFMAKHVDVFFLALILGLALCLLAAYLLSKLLVVLI